MATFKPGDRARIKSARWAPHLVGQECRVVSGLYTNPLTGAPVHDIDVGAIRDWCAPPGSLEPVRHDGFEAGDWKALGFHPSDFMREVEA